MKLKFAKMHGLGNDFVVFDAVNQRVGLTEEQVRFVANRRVGIGCDQVLLVEPSSSAGVDFRYRIFNADGSEVQQCGNGARCFARFVRDEGLTHKDEITVETASGVIRLYVEPDGQIRVNMGTPQFAPESLPFLTDEEQPRYELAVHDKRVVFGAVSMGNPHVVLKVKDVRKMPVEVIGPALQAHHSFPEGVNVGFMEVVSPRHVRLRVYERGAGETPACGTGACAAVAIGRRWQLLDPNVTVDLPGGRLAVRWDGGDAPLWMIGPATRVFEGIIEI